MATRNERYVWATAADLRWWYDQLKKLSVETERTLWAARRGASTALEVETLTDRVVFIDHEIVEVLDELDRRIGLIAKKS